MLPSIMAQPPYVVITIEPTFRITDWNGRAIEAAQSRGNVVAVADFSDNLMRLESALWPTAAVLQKLCRNPRHEEAFDGQARQLLTERLGFYSDLQSLHSEDAITWSFFGTLSMASPVKRTAFLNWLLKRIELPANEKDCTIELWRRIPHPDTQGMGGPEIDFFVQGDRTIIVGEAKWRSGEGSGQGLCGNKSQLQLRREFCDGVARHIFREFRFVIVNVVWHSPFVTDSPCDSPITMRTIAWSDLASWSEHPNTTEFRLYYEWKQRWSKK